jgi:hypothetical protein
MTGLLFRQVSGLGSTIPHRIGDFHVSHDITFIFFPEMELLLFGKSP